MAMLVREELSGPPVGIPKIALTQLPRVSLLKMLVTPEALLLMKGGSPVMTDRTFRVVVIKMLLVGLVVG